MPKFNINMQWLIPPETISYYEFNKLLALPPLSESESLRETLGALRSAEDAKSLPGCSHLAEVQNHLVDLIGYVEGKEGYTLFQGERKKCRMSAPLRTEPAN